MNPPPSPNRSRRRIALALVFSLCLGIILCDRSLTVRTAHAGSSATKEKVGSDLRKKVKESLLGEESLNVIIQPKSTWNATLDSDLKGKGATIGAALKNFAARSVKMKAKYVEALAARSDVGYVSLDREAKQLGHITLTTGADAAAAMTGGSGKYDGAGVGIVVMDSGVDAGHMSLGGRVVYSQDFTGEGRTDDPYGHGTHVASIAAGSGAVSNGAYQGIAPSAKIINLRVLGTSGTGTTSAILRALDWVMTNRTNPTYNIKVVNMSLGTAAIDSYVFDPLCVAVRRLTAAGIVVVAAAGNEGKDGFGNRLYGMIHSPGNDPSVITVGAVNTFGTDVRMDDGIASFSSRGPTRSFWTDGAGVRHFDNLVKPDLAAPGNRIIAAASPNNLLLLSNPLLDAYVSGSPNKRQMYMSGTSMATPVVAGAAALLKQANPTLTPSLVKMALMYTAQPLAGFNNLEQGSGALNLEGAMRLAKLIRTDLSASTPVGDPLLCASCAAPTPQTTLAGQTFYWGQGVIMDHSFATGANLILKYQAVYGLGVMLCDGTMMNDGVLLSDAVMMSDGITLSESIITSNGSTLDAGSIFTSSGVMLADGVMISDGVMLSDGGKVTSDGAMSADGVMAADVAAQARLALINGDETSSMPVQLDGTPGALKAVAASKSVINLTWTDNSTNESGFRVERSTDGKTFTQVATVAANAKTYTNIGLSANKKYTYRIYAYNSKGVTAYSAVATAQTPSK
ncbi:MAG TPA: S8 family serine peptidase [Pyrinomonadaceae bacterium]|nr:S8 family serine peptidase [Pyrinomonadaceae bacterium]